MSEVQENQEQQSGRDRGERGDDKAKFSKKPGGKPARKKPCAFCMEKSVYIDYKDISRLRKYITEKGKIIPRRQTGLCAAHQRELTSAIKRARVMSLI